MGIWDVWRTVFRDSTWDLSRYEYWSLRRSIQPQVSDGILFFGTDQPRMVPTGREVIQTGLRIKTDRYQDVDVTVRLEITAAAHTRPDPTSPGWIVNDNNWFGVTTRALSFFVWDSYLFYIRQNGSIEFGIRDVHNHPAGPPPIIAPPPVPQVAQQAVTIRIRVEGDHIRTWVNDEPRHNERDELGRFATHSGWVYLHTYGVAARLYEVEVRAKFKKWFGPFYNLITLGGNIQNLGGIILWVCVLISAAASAVYLYDYFFKSK